MRKLLYIAIFISCFIPTNVKAEDGVHAMAHIGGSAMINTFGFGIWNKVFQAPIGLSMASAGLLTVAGGLIYNMQNGASTAHIKRALVQNLIGIAISDLTIYTFKLYTTYEATSLTANANGLQLNILFN